LCSKTELNGILSFETDFPDPAPQFSRDIDIMLFRVIQEFINNSIKHGHANRIKIKINPTENNETIIVLEDDGVGFDVNIIKESKGMGIDNIKSRLALYNAQLNIKSFKDKGTIYTIKLFQNPDITIDYEQE
jgi:signal transduction histidine kinase